MPRWMKQRQHAVTGVVLLIAAAIVVGVAVWAATPRGKAAAAEAPGVGDVNVLDFKVYFVGWLETVYEEIPDNAQIQLAYPVLKNLDEHPLILRNAYALVEIGDYVEVCLDNDVLGIGGEGAFGNWWTGGMKWFQAVDDGFMMMQAGPTVLRDENYTVRVGLYLDTSGGTGWSEMLRGTGTLLATEDFTWRYPAAGDIVY